MALNNLWGKLGAFSRNVLVPSNVIYKSFDADPLVSDKMSRAISRWYGMYVDKPERIGVKFKRGTVHGRVCA